MNDYNPLMKDFPLEDLLSATELARIRSALVGIFLHMRKIRSTRYPVQRALRLIEAISRDLGAQLLKVHTSLIFGVYSMCSHLMGLHSAVASCRDIECG